MSFQPIDFGGELGDGVQMDRQPSGYAVYRKLYETRAQVQHVLGSDYDAQAAPYKKEIERLMKRERKSALAAMNVLLLAILAIPGNHPMPRKLLISAGLDLAEQGE